LQLPFLAHSSNGLEAIEAKRMSDLYNEDDLDRIYRQALRGLPETMDGQPPLAVPQVCPVTLDELLAEA
jgi:hypothetical protein